MNIAACIKHLHPDLAHSEWRVSDENGEQVISKWPDGLARPAAEDIASAWKEVSAERLLRGQIPQVLTELESIFVEEFSAVPGGLMAPLFAGLVELIKRGMFDRARVLVDSVTTPPPGITEQRMEEVKTQIKALFP